MQGPPQVEAVKLGNGVWRNPWYPRITWASGRTWHPTMGWASDWAAHHAGFLILGHHYRGRRVT